MLSGHAPVGGDLHGGMRKRTQTRNEFGLGFITALTSGRTQSNATVGNQHTNAEKSSASVIKKKNREEKRK